MKCDYCKEKYGEVIGIKEADICEVCGANMNNISDSPDGDNCQVEQIVIKPCPFCGEKNQNAISTNRMTWGYWFVSCLNCDCKGPNATTEKACIKKWNNRVL